MRLKILCISIVVLAASLAAQQERREEPAQSPAVFKSSVQLVEVYATVFDKHDEYLTDLSKDQFEIRDDGKVCPVETLEPVTTGFSCAIVMDRTGSILGALPTVKNSINRFIDSFRPEDQLAVYSFNDSLHKIQDFTHNKSAAKQAVLRTIAMGPTALFDSISEVLQELSYRKGKKTTVVFTDGNDNASYLNAAAVVRRAKGLGIPLYFIAHGEARDERSLLEAMRDMSQATGGQTHVVGKPAEVGRVFDRIIRDLYNSYLLTYTPPAFTEKKWRTIELAVKGHKDLRIRAREGYFPR